MIRIAVTGCAGKMGKTNLKVIHEDSETEIGGACEYSESPFIGMDAGQVAGLGQVNISISSHPSEAFKNCHAAIDFSSPSALKEVLKAAADNKTALVIGTTGVTPDIHDLIQKTSEIIPVIWAPNYSVGVHLITRLTEIAAEILKDDFDPEIVEAHHKMKKDSPSGTAVQLLETVKKVYNTQNVTHGREGIVGERPKNEIGMHAIRGGDVIGDHTVHFLGMGERIEITHRATSRETFARGALRAAKYLVKKEKGFYTMKDILGI